MGEVCELCFPYTPNPCLEGNNFGQNELKQIYDLIEVKVENHIS